jgi:cell division control protein 6
MSEYERGQEDRCTSTGGNPESGSYNSSTGADGDGETDDRTDTDGNTSSRDGSASEAKGRSDDIGSAAREEFDDIDIVGEAEGESDDSEDDASTQGDELPRRPAESPPLGRTRDSSDISPEAGEEHDSSSSQDTEGDSTPPADEDEDEDQDDQSPDSDGTERGEETTGLFDDLLSGDPIFEDKEVLRPAYTPRDLPHREDQIDNMATILVSALRGDTPSNILIYGKTGTGKTASAKFVSDELEATSQKYDVPCDVEYINCEVTDTQYRVLAQLANQFIEKNRERITSEIADLKELREDAQADPTALTDTRFDSVEAMSDEIETLRADRDSFDDVPMTGWPTDRVYNSFFDAIDYRERVVVIMLDEIDKLVEKSGDDTLYNLSRMNSDLEHSRVSIIGISNDLKFTDFLDPRVKSSLGEEEIVFPPYDANQLRDILEHRAAVAFVEDALTDDVIPLCAAFAAQEHGDARRALDLLRTAGELAERDDTDQVEEYHVREAQEKIEIDRVVEVVRTLPQQSKLVLFAIILLEKEGAHNINTGEVYNVYKQLCGELDADVLTQRRVTDLISELDMLGIVNAVVVSKGRYGRTKEISLSVPLEETEGVLMSDSRLGDIEDIQPSLQARFDS